jgi:hypothetical protein
MMKNYITATLICFSSISLFAQSFSVSSESLVTAAPVDNYVTGEIDMTNNSGSDLYLAWEVINRTVPSTFDYSYCDFNTCYPGTSNSGAMAVVPDGQNGFIKVNTMTTAEGWAYWQFRVYNVNDPADADTIGFWFNGIADVEEIDLTKISVFPNPASINENITISNVPSNSTLTVINSLGQIVLKEENVSGTKILNAQKLPKGVNFIKFQTGKESLTRKVIVR